MTLAVDAAGAGRDIEITADELGRATEQLLARELLMALRGRGRYSGLSRWPAARRKRRGVARRSTPSIQQWTSRRWRGGIVLTNAARHASLLEHAARIRGHRNRHYRAAARTIDAVWTIAAGAAADGAADRVASNRIRRVKAQAARAARAAA